MIISNFDNHSEVKINPKPIENRLTCDTCIIIFSNIIEDYVLNHYECKKIGELKFVTGPLSVYELEYKNKVIAFYKTYMGAPATVGALEDATEILDTNKFIVFGEAGSLNKNISHGKIMVPTYAYRDEGTSYHYATPSDYIKIENAPVVSNFMKEQHLPFIEGKTWTTDTFYRETVHNFEKRKQDSCISVEIECSALQAVCNFRNLEFIYLKKIPLISGNNN